MQRRHYMKYRVHHIDVDKNTMQDKLEQFLNKLNGEVISVFPNLKPTFTVNGSNCLKWISEYFWNNQKYFFNILK